MSRIHRMSSLGSNLEDKIIIGLHHSAPLNNLASLFVNDVNHLYKCVFLMLIVGSLQFIR